MILYNTIDFESSKKSNPLKKYANKIKQLFRSSFSYKYWVSMQHQTKRLICPFSGVDGNLSGHLIELHHHPFTMSDLIYLQIQKFCQIKEEQDDIDDRWHILNQYSEFEVIQILQDQHVLDLIPFVPLSITYHKWIHSLIDVEDEDHSQMLEDIEIKDEYVINLDKINQLKEFFGNNVMGGIINA